MSRDSSEAPVRRRVIVHGRVQGVWFRGATERQARAAGVAGWVCNRADGTVEAVFEGSAGATERLVSWCRTGPPGARVDRIERFDEAPEGLRDFAVR